MHFTSRNENDVTAGQSLPATLPAKNTLAVVDAAKRQARMRMRRVTGGAVVSAAGLDERKF